MKKGILLALLICGGPAKAGIQPPGRSIIDVRASAGKPEQIREEARWEVSPLAESKAVKNVGVAEFEKLRAEKTNIVLDVRSKKEFAAGHIPGAINIDVNGPEFQKQVQALDRNKVYLVHCAAGRRSAAACQKMDKLNFPRLYNLEGGLTAWENAGHKPEK